MQEEFKKIQGDAITLRKMQQNLRQCRNSTNRGKLRRGKLQRLSKYYPVNSRKDWLFWPRANDYTCRLFAERLEKKEEKVSIFCSMGGRVYGSRSNRDIRSLWNFMLTYGTCIFHDFIIISHLGLRNAKFLEWAFYRFCRSEIRDGVPTIKVIFVWLGHISCHDTRVYGVFVYFQEESSILASSLLSNLL